MLLLTQFPVKTARTKGVITAFITMSDIKDEIDWEVSLHLVAFTLY